MGRLHRRSLRRGCRAGATGGAPSAGSPGSRQFPGPACRCLGGDGGLYVLARGRGGRCLAPRTPRHGHRPVQAATADRRRRHGHGLHGRADPARPAQGRPQGDQARHGQPAGHRPLRGRAAGAGDDGPRQHRPRLRRRRHGDRPAVLRDGAGPRRADHQVLRRQPPDAARAAGAVRAGLPGDPARPPEGNHPPRHQAVQRHGHALRRQAGAQGDRLRRGQGDRAKADRADPVHAVRHHGRHAGIHEPGAGGDERPGRRYPQRHLLAGRAPVRTADGQHAALPQAGQGGGVSPRSSA